jgi:hypothetical protein
MDWKTLLLGAFIGAIIAIPFSVFGNLVTPWVKSYFEKRKLTTQERRIYILASRYKSIKKMKENLVYFILLAFRQIALLFVAVFFFIGISAGITINFVGDFKDSIFADEFLNRVVIFLALLICSYFSYDIIKDINTIMRFDKFREKTIAKLKKLGGNPEELDKIDREIEAEKQRG